MPCFRSVIRAATATTWCGPPLRSSAGPNVRILSLASLSGVSVANGHCLNSQRPGADARLPAAGQAIGLCTLFQKGSRAATVAMPKAAHLTIGAYDHHQQRMRLRDGVEHTGAAETATRYRSTAQHVSTILSLALNSWVYQHDVAPESTFSSLDAEANAQVALEAVFMMETSRGCLLTVCQARQETNQDGVAAIARCSSSSIRKPFRGPWGVLTFFQQHAG
ncbi:hypothetical protein QBC39DRAFT_48229 [Podospora conica]|nr:hypothetical protein QBC39DRAFT_48229 [Schizothecium conicum]